MVSKHQIIESLRSYLERKVLAPGVRIDDTTAFADVGIDSVTVIELSLELEDRFGIDLPAEALVTENLRDMNAMAECALRYAKL